MKLRVLQQAKSAMEIAKYLQQQELVEEVFLLHNKSKGIKWDLTIMKGVVQYADSHRFKRKG